MTRQYNKFPKRLKLVYIILVTGILFELIFTIFAIIYQKNFGESLFLGMMGLITFLLFEFYNLICLLYYRIKKYEKKIYFPFLLNFLGVMILVVSLLILVTNDYSGLKLSILYYLLPVSVVSYYGLKITSIFLVRKVLFDKNPFYVRKA